MLDTLIQYDKEFFFFLNSLGSETWDGLWLFITNKYAFIPLYALLLYLIYRKTGWKSTLLTMIIVAAMITTTDQLSNLFKSTFARPRPCQPDIFEEAIRFVVSRCGRYGYFSAHAASSMALAVFVGMLLKNHYKNLVFILLFWSALVSYSRIYVGVHYPLDIISGMIIGGIAGFLYYKLQQVLQKRYL